MFYFLKGGLLILVHHWILWWQHTQLMLGKRKRVTSVFLAEALRTMSLLHRARSSAPSATRKHSVKRLLSFLGEASFIATEIWHMVKTPKFGKNPDNAHWRNRYAAGYTKVPGSCAGVHLFMYAHKACWSICIRSLHIIRMFALILTLKLQLEV